MRFRTRRPGDPEEACDLRVAADHEAVLDARAGLHDLRVEQFPYGPFGPRVWELRENLTAFNAWYVALAEELGVPLATLDGRLRRAPGTRCDFTTPPRLG